MKKFNFKSLKLRRMEPDELSERFLLANVYVTQFFVLLLSTIIMLFQKPNLKEMFSVSGGAPIWLWGAGFAIIVLIVDMVATQWVPPEVTDDGGINEMLFSNRPLWHIAVLSFVVAVCEELLFRGAIQAAWGPYWTSILFAAIHIRYLQSWLMTGLVFSISYGLGWIYIHTGSLWTPIFAHFLIDFVMGCILRYRRETE